MDTGDEELAEFIEQLEGKFYARLDRAIAVDTGQAEILSGDFGVPRGKITVIHNAVDVVNVGRPTPEFQVRRETAQRILVLPRRLVEKNGPLVALEALALLPRIIGFGLWETVHCAPSLRPGQPAWVWKGGFACGASNLAAM